MYSFEEKICRGFLFVLKAQRKHGSKGKQNASTGFFFHPKSDLIWIFLNVDIRLCGNSWLDYVTLMPF